MLLELTWLELLDLRLLELDCRLLELDERLLALEERLLEERLLEFDCRLLELDFKLPELDDRLLRLEDEASSELLELEDKLDLLLELDTALENELRLDDELSLLLELDMFELDTLELDRLELDRLELDRIELITLELLLRELTIELAELRLEPEELRLDCTLLKLAWLKPALDNELILASELAELMTIATELRLVALTLDELAKAVEEAKAPGRSSPCFATLEADELAAADTLAELIAATELAAKLPVSPAPPPQAFNKITASHPRLHLNARENLTGCI